MRLPKQSTSVRRFPCSGHTPKRAIYASRVAQYVNPLNPGELWFCYGLNENTNSCELYAFHNKQDCDTLTPCSWSPLQAILRQPVRVKHPRCEPTKQIECCTDFSSAIGPYGCASFEGDACPDYAPYIAW
jgi:hypothetical protein